MKFDNGAFTKLTNIVIVYWKYCLLKWIKRGYNHNFSRTINKVWFLILSFFRRHFNIFCRLTEVLLQKYIKPTLKVSTLNWIEDRSMKRDRTEFFLPLHYIHNYILCLHDFTIDMDSIQKCNSAYKKGVKDISSHEKFILFRFSSRLCWDLLNFLY